MGEVGEARGSENQRESHRGQRQQEAEAKAGHEPVQQVLAEVLLLDHNAFAEGKDHGEVGSLAESDFAGILLAVSELDAFGESGLV
ncbi:hypothetical protein D9M72_423420 [compost metagenome]